MGIGYEKDPLPRPLSSRQTSSSVWVSPSLAFRPAHPRDRPFSACLLPRPPRRAKSKKPSTAHRPSRSQTVANRRASQFFPEIAKRPHEKPSERAIDRSGYASSPKPPQQAKKRKRNGKNATRTGHRHLPNTACKTTRLIPPAPVRAGSPANRARGRPPAGAWNLSTALRGGGT